MCMKKIVYVGRKKKALVCINPKCVEVDEKKAAKIVAQTEGKDQKELHIYGAVCTNLNNLSTDPRR